MLCSMFTGNIHTIRECILLCSVVACLMGVCVCITHAWRTCEFQMTYMIDATFLNSLCHGRSASASDFCSSEH